MFFCCYIWNHLFWDRTGIDTPLDSKNLTKIVGPDLSKNKTMNYSRDINNTLKIFRNFLLGRKHNTAHRFEETMSSRDYPPLCSKSFQTKKLSSNFYYQRNPRQEVDKPKIIKDEKNQIIDRIPIKTSSRHFGIPTPGKVYQWDK